VRATTILAAGLLLGAVLTGCTSPRSDPSVATARSAAPAATPTASVSSSPDPVKYAQCMRAHGMSWYPDPVDQSGRLGTAEPPAGVDKTKLAAAQEACRPYASGTDGPQPASAADKAKMLTFAQCMRANGLTTFPDPLNEGGFSLAGTGLKPNSPAFKAAQQKCENLMPTPPGGQKHQTAGPGGGAPVGG
jgi:hypothetical protein